MSQLAHFQAFCPMCREALRFDLPAPEDGSTPTLYGFIPVGDLACAEVTRPYSPGVEAHLNEHRGDGSWFRAFAADQKRRLEAAEAFFKRFNEDGTSREE